MQDPELTEKLISRIAADDSTAFEELFHLYHKRVYVFAIRLLPSSQDAEEIVQNVFMAIWNQRKDLHISTSFISYLYGIARHMIFEVVQRKIHHKAFIEYYLDHNQEYTFITEEEVFFHDLEGILHQLILELPERRREIFSLNRLEGLSYKEISEKLGISENTVDTQIRHALAYIRSQLTALRGA
jgi:RNA polymerase sigma-70 factor (ECF subfamily)